MHPLHDRASVNAEGRSEETTSQVVGALARAYTLSDTFPLHHPRVREAIDSACAGRAEIGIVALDVDRDGFRSDGAVLDDPTGRLSEFARGLYDAQVEHLRIDGSLNAEAIALFLFCVRQAEAKQDVRIADVLACAGAHSIRVAVAGADLAAPGTTVEVGSSWAPAPGADPHGGGTSPFGQSTPEAASEATGEEEWWTDDAPPAADEPSVPEADGWMAAPQPEHPVQDDWSEPSAREWSVEPDVPQWVSDEPAPRSMPAENAGWSDRGPDWSADLGMAAQAGPTPHASPVTHSTPDAQTDLGAWDDSAPVGGESMFASPELEAGTVQPDLGEPVPLTEPISVDAPAPLPLPSLEAADTAPLPADLETVPADPIHHLAAPQWDETPVAHADGAPTVHPTSGDAETPVTESLTPAAPGHPTAADDDTLAWVEDDLWVTDHWQAEEFRQALLDGTPETGVPDAYGWAQFDDPSPAAGGPERIAEDPTPSVDEPLPMAHTEPLVDRAPDRTAASRLRMDLGPPSTPSEAGPDSATQVFSTELPETQDPPSASLAAQPDPRPLKDLGPAPMHPAQLAPETAQHRSVAPLPPATPAAVTPGHGTRSRSAPGAHPARANAIAHRTPTEPHPVEVAPAAVVHPPVADPPSTSAAAPPVQPLLQAIHDFIGADDRDRPEIEQRILSEVRAATAQGPSPEVVDAVEVLLYQTPTSDRGADGLAGVMVTDDIVSELLERLGEIRDDQTRERLGKVTRRISADMAPAVAEALNAVPPRHVRRNLLNAIFTMGRDALRQAIPMLDDNRWFIVRNGVDILGEVGEADSVPILVPIMGHGDARVRVATVRAMAKIGGDDAQVNLTRALDDPDSDVREAAAMAVGHLRADRALRPLLALLDRERDEEFQLVIIRSLGQLGATDAVPHLEKRATGGLLRRPSKAVRIAAYRALASIGSPHARQLLVAAAEDRDHEVAMAARSILSRMNPGTPV